MVNTRSQYQPAMIRVARQVLLELTHIFRDDLDHLVFVGGMACALLFDQTTDPHEGTIDIDIALDPVALAEYGDDTLEDKLLYALYQVDVPKKYRWVRTVRLEGEAVEVKTCWPASMKIASVIRRRGKSRGLPPVSSVAWTWPS